MPATTFPQSSTKPKLEELPPAPSSALRIIPLGGLGEFGLNMMCYEVGEERLIVDCGSMQPSSDMLGIDLVIPDITYLLEGTPNDSKAFSSPTDMMTTSAHSPTSSPKSTPPSTAPASHSPCYRPTRRTRPPRPRRTHRSPIPRKSPRRPQFCRHAHPRNPLHTQRHLHRHRNRRRNHHRNRRLQNRLRPHRPRTIRLLHLLKTR